MKPVRTSPVRVIATLALAAMSFPGCDDEPVDEAAAATEAVRQIAERAPTGLPADVPDELLRVTLGGVEYNLRELLSRPSDSRPSARIVAAYRTVSTPANAPPFGTPEVAAYPPYPTYPQPEPAAQVYECRDNGAAVTWVFARPEAGLQPITSQPIPALDSLVLDHFRYPGGIDFGPPTGTPPVGPAWRVSAPVLDPGTPTAGQTLFVGSVDVTVANGSGNIPLLRLVNVARIDRGLPSDVFSRTTSDGTQTGYVLRLNTVGGIAPKTGCGRGEIPDWTNRGRVPYSADYYFIDVLTTP